MVASAIERIRAEHGHGAAVIIPAFNNFEHEQSLRDAVFRAAAFNFFQAIHEGRLVVEVVDSEGSGVLDAVALREVLAPYRDELRSGRTGAFLSGRRANEAYETLVDGELHEIRTAQGNVAVRLLRTRIGSAERGSLPERDVDHGRTADVPERLRGSAAVPGADSAQFGQRGRVLRADPGGRDAAPRQAGAEADGSGSAEGAAGGVARDSAMGSRNWSPCRRRTSTAPPDILAFQFEDVEGQGRGGRQPSFWGRVGTTRRSTMVRRKVGKRDPGGPGQGGGRGGRKGPDGRIVVEPIFRIASVPTREGRRTVHVECAEDFKDAELRMFVDENVDATCDRQTRAQAAAVLLSNVTVDGRPLAEEELVRNGEGAVGAKLGSLTANSRIVVETDYAIPAGAMRLLPGQNPALRIEIVSIRKTSSRDGGDTDGEALSDE